MKYVWSGLIKEACIEVVDCVNKTAPTVNYPTQYRMIRTSDIEDGHIRTDNLRFVEKDVFEKWTRRGILRSGDIIFTREAPVGRVAWLKDPTNMFLGQRTICFRPNPKIVNSKYLAYYLQNPVVIQSLIAKSSGSTVGHLRVGQCENIWIELPSLKQQETISEKIYSYDALIENNRKQIKLLEEAAQRLYKEWFINLRFPGYESTPINPETGLPEGWKRTPLNEYIDSHIGGGWGEDTPSSEYPIPAYVIRATDISNINSGNTNLPFRWHKPSNFKTRELCSGDIVFEVSGGSKEFGVGRSMFITQKLLDKLKYPVICASFCKLIRTHSRKESLLLFQQILHDLKNGAIRRYEKRSAGNIINFLWDDFFNSYTVLTPEDSLYNQYISIISPIRERIAILISECSELLEARDRLLPKLMSGEIEV